MTQLAATDYALGQASLDALLEGSPYLAYTYSYPHKTSYRAFERPFPLGELWADEDRSALFLYVHIPFCEMRCGFCNLFTMARPGEGLAAQYLAALRRQARVVRDGVGRTGYARVAIGGGTPTQLDEAGLVEVFEIVDLMGARTQEVPVACEMSPETITASKLAILRAHGVNRASIGVQSFIEAETRAVRRPQEPAVAHAAIEAMRLAGFETINIDLIYGMPGQSAATLGYSIEQALAHAPEELYLYPLYRRPHTGLGNSARAWDDARLALYRHGRDLLLAAGYEQVSMRMFRRRDAPGLPAPEYVCQRDGMVGLGAGARSYTEHVHYCTEYAVGRRGVTAIIDDFVHRDDRRHGVADYGFVLDEDERRRRDAILSLLSSEGLDEARFAARFGVAVCDAFGQLAALVERGLARVTDGVWRLTAEGMERSDVIGPWLYSAPVLRQMREYELQ